LTAVDVAVDETTKESMVVLGTIIKSKLKEGYKCLPSFSLSQSSTFGNVETDNKVMAISSFVNFVFFSI